MAKWTFGYGALLVALGVEHPKGAHVSAVGGMYEERNVSFDAGLHSSPTG